MGYVMDRRQVADQNQRPEQPNRFLNCPRCNSTNTKFCYYNNYSLSQPRHFCKACKRYWTRGGTLRNVPVGGGCRKNIKRVRKPPSSASSLSLLADAPPSSSNQISQMGTSMAAAADGATDNLLAPLFYSLAGMSSSYEDLIKQQQGSFSDMNVGSIDDPTDSFLSGYNNRISLRLPPPPSSVYLQDKDSGAAGQDTNNQGQLRQKLFPFQAMQQEQPRSTTLAGGHLPEDPQARRWNNNNVDHHRDQNDQRHNSSVYWAGHLADMDS